MRQLGAIMILLAFVAAGCSSGKHTGANGNNSAQVVAAASPVPPSSDQCPLTGQAPPDSAALSRPLLAVKIDGSQASKSPSGQSGLDAADMVYDEPVEGGFGWFLALYDCGNPSRVGPIRDARNADPGILSQYGSAIFASAAVPSSVTVTATAGLVSIDSVHHGSAFFRDAVVRKAPYNLFADPAKLRAVHVAGATTTAKPLAPPVSQFSFVPATASATAGSSHKAASIRFKLGPSVEYHYDAGSTAYLRSENGQAHLTDTGSQIRVTNVVIMWVTMNETPISGPGGNSTSPDPVLTGQGNAMVLSGGVEYDGQWTRTDASSPMHLVDSKGNPIPLRQGNTWIHILSKEEPVFVQ